MAGADLKTAKEMFEHSDIAMTDRYSYLSSFHERAVQDQLAAHYSRTDRADFYNYLKTLEY